MPFQRMINLLNSQTKDTHQTIKDAFINGTISDAELRRLNENTAFPNNAYGQLAANEPRYNSLEAMQDFVTMLGPKLSDKVLFDLNERLFKIEIERDHQAFRNTTLAKVFLQYEIKRYGSINENFLCHAKRHLLPFVQKNWPDQFEKNINEFIRFNFLSSLTNIKLPDNEAISQAVIKFDDHDFEKGLQTTVAQEETLALKSGSINSDDNCFTIRPNQISSPSNMIDATNFFIAEQKNKLLTILEEKQQKIITLVEKLIALENDLSLLQKENASKTACIDAMRENFELFDHLTINEATKIKLSLANLECQVAQIKTERDQEIEAYKNLEAKLATLCKENSNHRTKRLTSRSSLWQNTLNYSSIDEIELARRKAFLNEAVIQCDAKAANLEISISKLGKNFYDESPHNIRLYHNNKETLKELQQLRVGLDSLITGRNLTQGLFQQFEKNKSLFSPLVWQEINDIFALHSQAVTNSQTPSKHL